HEADEPVKIDGPTGPQGGSKAAPMMALEIAGLTKRFGAIEALTDVSLAIEAGEVVGLMGDNGAGKSTLVKMVAGNFPPSSGEIRLDGRVTHFHNPDDARIK